MTKNKVCMTKNKSGCLSFSHKTGCGLWQYEQLGILYECASKTDTSMTNWSALQRCHLFIGF